MCSLQVVGPHGACFTGPQWPPEHLTCQRQQSLSGQRGRLLTLCYPQLAPSRTRQLRNRHEQGRLANFRFARDTKTTGGALFLPTFAQQYIVNVRGAISFVPGLVYAQMLRTDRHSVDQRWRLKVLRYTDTVVCLALGAIAHYCSSCQPNNVVAQKTCRTALFSRVYHRARTSYLFERQRDYSSHSFLLRTLMGIPRRGADFHRMGTLRPPRTAYTVSHAEQCGAFGHDHSALINSRLRASTAARVTGDDAVLYRELMYLTSRVFATKVGRFGPRLRVLWMPSHSSCPGLSSDQTRPVEPCQCIGREKAPHLTDC